MAISRKQALQRQLAAIAEQVAQLESRPEEPDWDNPVITFKKTFADSRNYPRGTVTREYTYSAVKVNNGSWYCSGRSGLNQFTWDSLLDFIELNEPSMPEIWVATEWQQVV